MCASHLLPRWVVHFLAFTCMGNVLGRGKGWGWLINKAPISIEFNQCRKLSRRTKPDGAPNRFDTLVDALRDARLRNLHPTTNWLLGGRSWHILCVLCHVCFASVWPGCNLMEPIYSMPQSLNKSICGKCRSRATCLARLLVDSIKLRVTFCDSQGSGWSWAGLSSLANRFRNYRRRDDDWGIAKYV